MKFYLGTHMPHWLTTMDVPLFISYNRLSKRKTLPVARAPWALDSGGFTMLSMHGEWLTTAPEYATFVDRAALEIGNLDWAAPMDWMCEPWILNKTGLGIIEHQRRTVESVLALRSLVQHAHIIPVLQGWEIEDYLNHVAMYEFAGIHLADEPVVGVGSICRRQGTGMATALIDQLYQRDIAIHAFGFKTRGLSACQDELLSADSMAWSYDARRNPPLPGCTTHKNCANCDRYALLWRDRLLTRLEAARSEFKQLRFA